MLLGLEVLGGSCSDNGVDGTKTKSKESGDEVFSDAVAEFSEGIGPNKSMGDALNSESTSKMVAEDEMNSSRATNDTEVLGKFNVWDNLSSFFFACLVILLAVYGRSVSYVFHGLSLPLLDRK